MKDKKGIVIFDIEASCEDRNINPRYNMETIEIGAVKVYRDSIVDTFETFICPEYVNDLTPFCIELTGITFDDLKDAPNFAEAILEFYKFIYGCEIYSCGDFDRKHLTKELEEKGYSYEHELARNAINANHKDLKKYYNKITGKKKKGMMGMARELGVELTGTHHRALSDAQNLTKVFLKLEEIRENELKKTFTDKAMDKLIYNLNKNHNNFEIEKDGEDYKVNYKLTNQTHKLGFLEFMDLWSNSIIIDIETRGLKYINPQSVKILNRYTIL